MLEVMVKVDGMVEVMVRVTVMVEVMVALRCESAHVARSRARLRLINMKYVWLRVQST
jgi:hypothetical protein|tara:strand:- start:640 stop:813 length:174 start_codon:yes stop_codon:yes gene_type:complete